MVIFVSVVITITAVPVVRGAATAYIAVLAGMAVLVTPLFAIAWFNEHTPIGTFLVQSFQAISGITSSKELYVGCATSNPIGALFLTLLTWLPMIVAAACGFTATLCVPLGAVGTAGSSLYTLATRDKTPLVFSIKWLAIGLCCVVGAGLGLRLAHYLSGLKCG